MEFRKEFEKIYCVTECLYEKFNLDYLLKEWNKGKISNYFIIDLLIESFENVNDNYAIKLNEKDLKNHIALTNDLLLNINTRTKQYLIYNFTCREDLITKETRNYVRNEIFFNVYKNFLPKKYEFEKLIRKYNDEEKTILINIYNGIIEYDNIYYYLLNEDNKYLKNNKNIYWPMFYEKNDFDIKLKGDTDDILKENIIRDCRLGNFDFLNSNLDLKEPNFRFYCLNEASSGGHENIIEYFKPFSISEMDEIIIKSIKYNKQNIFYKYFDKNNINENYLYVASKYGNTEIFIYLFNLKRYSQNIYDQCFESSIKRGNLNMVQLLSFKINFDLLNKTFRICINRNYTDVAEYLLEKFDNYIIKNSDFAYGLENKNYVILRLFLNKGVNKQILEDNYNIFAKYLPDTEYLLLKKYTELIEPNNSLLLKALSDCFKEDNLTSFKYLYYICKDKNILMPDYIIKHIEMAKRDNLYEILEFLEKF